MKSRVKKFRIALFKIFLMLLFVIGMLPAEKVKAAEIYTFNYNGSVQTFKVPKFGLYKLECWGSVAPSGGQGGYAKGEIALEKGDTLLIYCGGSNGFNGGGTGASQSARVFDSWDERTVYSGNGGGGTDIRLSSNVTSRLLAAGGGGGYQEAFWGGFDHGPWWDIGTAVRSVSGSVNSNGNLGQGSNGYAAGRGMYKQNCCSNPQSKMEITALGGGGGGWYGGSSGYNGVSGVSALPINIADKKYVVKSGAVLGNSNTGNGYAKITYLGANLEIEVQPKDAAALDTGDAVFKTCSKAASEFGSYEWQIYEGENWNTIGSIAFNEKNKDYTLNELNYSISLKFDEYTGATYSNLTVKSCQLGRDSGKKFRCIVYDDTKNSVISDEADLTIKRNGYSKIIASYYKTADAGSTIDINDVLVALLYESGLPDFASGWSNLYFVVTKNIIESRTENKSGSVSEIVETVTEETKTYRLEYGINNVTVRLKDMNPEIILDEKGDPVLDHEGNPTYNDCTKEATFQVRGMDEEKPKFLNVTISDYEVINEDEEKNPIDVTFQLEGEDNYTNKDKLLYALKKKEDAVVDGDFTNESKYTIEIKENSTYIAYVKDEAGNIESKEIEIIIVDDKDPIIKSKSLIFKEDDGWVNRNIIRVDATDNYKPELLQFCFTLPEGMEDKSEKSKFGVWMNENEITITENGIYGIEVKDFVGNITKTTINVKNVDAVGPEIKNVEIEPIS